MDSASRYGGSSRSQRSMAAVMSGLIVLLLLVAFGRAVEGAVSRMAAPLGRWMTFTIAPPAPPRPVVLDRAPIVHRSVAANARRVMRPRASASPTRVPYVAAPAISAPVPALPPNDVAMSVSTDLPQLDASAIDGGGSDSGKGSGAGDGKGSTRPVKLIRADWIRPPDRRDFQREWRRSGLDLALPVEVVLLCDVHNNGHPFDCVVAHESIPGKGFGAAAIRLVHDTLIKPMTIDDKRVDIRVVVPISFTNARVDGKPPHPQTTSR